MPEEEDFQKKIFKALGALKNEIMGLDQRIGSLEKSTTLIFNVLKTQAQAKGSTCTRVATNPNGDKYCTAWGQKFVPKGVEDQFVLVGGRYHPKPESPWCYWCPRFEKKD